MSKMMRQAALTSFVAISGILSATNSNAQPPKPVQSSQFEVATIKPGDPKLEGYSSHSGGLQPGGQFQLVNTSLRQWVEMGLSVKDSALKAPSWLDTSKFDLEARMPPGKPFEPEMIRALLIERFGLKWHEETQIVPGFELVPDKKVLLKPATALERLEGAHGSGWGPSVVNGTNMSMSDFAALLGQVLGRPVVDATHLSGGFDIKLVWLPDNEATAAEWKSHEKQYGMDVDNLPSSVTTAVREQLGLRLQSATIPWKVIVVDQINNHPTPN